MTRTRLARSGVALTFVVVLGMSQPVSAQALEPVVEGQFKAARFAL